MKKTFLLSAACVALTVISAKAQTSILYATTFNAPIYTDGVLNVGTDTTTAGQDGWLNTSGGGTNNIAVSNSATNGLVSLTTSGQDVRRLFNGAQTVTSGSVYLQADINVSAAQTTGDYFLHFSDGSTANFYARTFIKSSGAGFVLALGTGAGAVTYGTTVLNLGTTYTLLIRYDFVAGTTNDTGALFVNPTTVGGTGDTPYVAATTIGTDATTIGAVALRQGSATAAPTLTVDNIQAYVVVPEPSTYACLGLGVLGIFAVLRTRRRTA